MKKAVYIEGSRDTDNGDLRTAFSKLLEKELRGNMPKIVMGDGKDQTIDKFFSAPLDQDGEQRLLLVDSDKEPPVDKAALCKVFNRRKKCQPNCKEDNTFLMIQEAEAWVLSQPEVLNSQKIDIGKHSLLNVMQIAKPSKLLARIYRENRKTYHKVRDLSRLLPKLDSQKLKNDFGEFNELISQLKS